MENLVYGIFFLQTSGMGKWLLALGMMTHSADVSDEEGDLIPYSQEAVYPRALS